MKDLKQLLITLVEVDPVIELGTQDLVESRFGIAIERG
jgi:hypothetical protein